MAAKKATTGFEFIIASLKKNKKASYKDIAAAAAAKKMKLFPVMFGRAQAMLGIVSSSKRGKKGARSKVVPVPAKAVTARSKVAPVPAKVVTARSKVAPVPAKAATARAKAATARAKAATARSKVAPVRAKAAVRRPAVVVGKRGPGRPRKNATPTLDGTLESIIAGVKSGVLEKARYRKVLERIQRLVAAALA
jgi:hypothetical protein